MNTNGNGFGLWRRHSPWKRKHGIEDDLAPYRRLALQLHYDLQHREGARTVLLATPTPSDLCARGSLLLCYSMAEQLCRPVLLVDACPEKPEASRIMDCTKSQGFANFVSNPNLPLRDLALPTNCENVFFMPVGISSGQSLRVSAENIIALLKAAESRYDFVFFSGGSVLNDPLSLTLAHCVNRVFLLAIENETRVEDLDAAQDALAACKASDVAMLLMRLGGSRA